MRRLILLCILLAAIARAQSAAPIAAPPPTQIGAPTLTPTPTRIPVQYPWYGAYITVVRR